MQKSARTDATNIYKYTYTIILYNSSSYIHFSTEISDCKTLHLSVLDRAEFGWPENWGRPMAQAP